jgi:hypothetical protein
MKIITLIAIAAGLFASAADAQQKPAGTPDLFMSPKTLTQFLNEGWEVKNGQFSAEIRGVTVFLVRGHDFAYCYLSDSDPKTNRKMDAMFSSCMSTSR